MRLTIERFTHSLKTAFACMLGLMLTNALNFYPDPWLIVTVLVVMCAQLNVGGLLQKSYMRFLGTLAGSLIAASTILWLNLTPLTIMLVIAFSSLLFSFLSTGQNKLNDAGTLGAVTVVVILIGQNPTLITALHRFIEISIGIVLAAIVSQFILPIQARTHLRNSQAKTIRQIRDYYMKTLFSDEKNYIELDETIVKSLIAQRKLAADAIREPFGLSFRVTQFNQYLWYAREILRSVSFMHQTYEASPECRKIFSAVTEFHELVCHALVRIADGIEKGHVDDFQLPMIAPLKHAIPSKLSEEDMISLHAFLFCAEVLVTYLRKLVELVNERH